MIVQDIEKNKSLMKVLKEVRENIYKDISPEARAYIQNISEKLTDEEKEVVRYFTEPALTLNFGLEFE